MTNDQARGRFCRRPDRRARRLLDEESMLSAELKGYQEYRQRVRYRLVPYLW